MQGRLKPFYIDFEIGYLFGGALFELLNIYYVFFDMVLLDSSSEGKFLVFLILFTPVLFLIIIPFIRGYNKGYNKEEKKIFYDKVERTKKGLTTLFYLSIVAAVILLFGFLIYLRESLFSFQTYTILYFILPFIGLVIIGIWLKMKD